MPPPAHPPLILVHGALGAADQLAPLAAALAGRCTPVLVELEGHGASPPAGRALRIEHFAENLLGALDAQAIDRAEVFGYSLGGYVALYLARHRPERIGRIMTLGTKLRWSPSDAERETRLLDPVAIRDKVPRFAEALARRHGPERWSALLGETAEMMRHLGEEPTLGDEDFRAIAQPVRLAVGDRDTTAGVEDTVGAWRLLPAGELEVLPATPHPVERVDPAQLARSVGEFFGLG